MEDSRDAWAEQVYEAVAGEVCEGLKSRDSQRALQPSLDFADHNIAGITQAVDRAAAQAGTAGIACRTGCAICCHFRVSALPIEVFNVARYVDARFSAEERSGLVEKLERYIEEEKDLPMRALYRCPALGADDRCTVYAARPLVCRMHHSRSVEACAKLETPTPVMLEYAAATAPILQGIQDGAARAGTAPDEVEYVPGLLTALTEPDAESRWLDGEDVFAGNAVLFLDEYRDHRPDQPGPKKSAPTRISEPGPGLD